MSASPQVITPSHSSARRLGIATTVLSLVLIVVGALGLILVQQPLQQSQDTRGDAMVVDGTATISVVQAPSTSLRAYQPARLDFRVNTNNVATKGLRLLFNVETETTDVITFQTYSDSNLEIISQEIEATGDGFLVSFEAVPRSGTFTTSSDRNILSLEFTPQRSGTFKINFDQSNSTMVRVDNNQDTLRSVGQLSFSIDGSSISSTTGKSCNESCSSNSECQTNHRCYENRCRLVTNPSSDSCATPPDKGLQRQCNEYCADTRECASGFTCFFNRCRRPENPDSTSCQQTTAGIQAQIAQNCNKSCGSNADCSNNMRCFQGQCRLATNPSSTSCRALTQPSVSANYGSTKGGSTTPASPRPTATSSARPATNSATTRPATASALLNVTPTPRPTLLPSPTPTIMPDSNRGIFSGISWPLLALGAGILLLLLVILAGIISSLRRRGPKGSISAVKAPPTAYESQLQAKIDQLKSQGGAPAPTMAAPAVTPATPTPSLPPARPTATLPVAAPTPSLPAATPQPVLPPTTSKPAPAAIAPTAPVTPPPSTLRTVAAPAVPPPAPMPASPRPTASPLPTTQAAVAPTAARTSSMMDRIRAKAVTPPGQSVTQPTTAAPAPQNQVNIFDKSGSGGSNSGTPNAG